MGETLRRPPLPLLVFQGASLPLPSSLPQAPHEKGALGVIVGCAPVVEVHLPRLSRVRCIGTRCPELACSRTREDVPSIVGIPSPVFRFTIESNSRPRGGASHLRTRHSSVPGNKSEHRTM